MPGQITLIYARAANGVIGKDGQLPWHISEDLKRFKALTMGAPIIMGRKTFDSFAKLLPGRRHIVVTRNKKWEREGAEVAHSIEQAASMVASEEAWVIGGAEIYLAFMEYADRVELTQIHEEYDGDTFMPELGAEWETVAREDYPAHNGLPAYSFITLEKVP